LVQYDATAYSHERAEASATAALDSAAKQLALRGVRPTAWL
jgi:hypothetical protein